MLTKTGRILKSKLFIGFLLGIITIFSIHKAVDYTSSDPFCTSCHIHPHATVSWKRSTHYDNRNGIVVHCVECHLPTGGVSYYTEKMRLGLQDIFGVVFKEPSQFNWDEKSRLDHAVTYTYKESCLRCHQNLFPLTLSKKGEEAHLHYSQNPGQIRCINCHLYVGHYSEQAQQVGAFGKTEKKPAGVYAKPAAMEKFENFTEFIPGSRVKFDMIAIPGGTFKMGSPPSEPYRDEDEGPVRTVQISPFWIGKVEVTWDEYEAFYRQTAAEGRTGTRRIYAQKVSTPDAITGATPPYGNPDQRWGKGARPAITMTHHAATVYCRWLSKVTGKKYRLPTEAEWEYACRGGTESSYFFPGDVKKFTGKRFLNKIVGVDTAVINRYVIYAENSKGKTAEPWQVKPNPCGLLNMSGNVWEFCSDWYSPQAYARNAGEKIVADPTGPKKGTGHVVRGGSFKSDAVDVRSAARDYTRHDDWLVTDPQIPKSIWWYSDCIDVGFRVVCEYEGGKIK
ncbi:MAG TPA: hypothetical protein ENH29_09075 [Bacteroidetes bacterium]|nr:hypothetical protein [Bacteroidota bacterium]